MKIQSDRIKTTIQVDLFRKVNQQPYLLVLPSEQRMLKATRRMVKRKTDKDLKIPVQ